MSKDKEVVNIKLSKSKQIVVAKITDFKEFYTAVYKPTGLEPCNLILWPIIEHNIRENTVTVSISRGLFCTLRFDLPNFGRLFYSNEFKGFFYAQIKTTKQLEKAVEMLKKIEKSYYI